MISIRYIKSLYQFRAAPFLRPGLDKKRVIACAAAFPPVGKERQPNDAGDTDDDQIKRPQQRALQAVAVFVADQAAAVRLFFRDVIGDKNKDAQRQTAAEPQGFRHGARGDEAPPVPEMRFVDKT